MAFNLSNLRTVDPKNELLVKKSMAVLILKQCHIYRHAFSEARNSLKKKNPPRAFHYKKILQHLVFYCFENFSSKA